MDFTVINQDNISLTGKLVGSTIQVEYSAMLYEQPANNNCFLSVWQDVQVPFGKPGSPTNPIIGDQRTGSQTFDQLTTNVPYIVGWGAGNDVGKNEPNYGSIGSAISFIPGSPNDNNGVVLGELHHCSITPALVGVDTIVVSFNTLQGNNPLGNKNWIGLWEGSFIDYNGGYLQKWDVTSSRNQDTQGLNTQQQIRSNATYTLAYASGPNASDIVASATFKTAAY